MTNDQESGPVTVVIEPTGRMEDPFHVRAANGEPVMTEPTDNAPLSAEARGMAMMDMPMNTLPPLALAFGKKLCSEVGMCSEVLLTAWTVYAQCAEGLTCTDEQYAARPKDHEWFKVQQQAATST